MIVGAYASGIVAAAFVEVGMELEFISEEFSRDVEFLAADYDDVLTIENLFGDNGCKSAWHRSATDDMAWREVPKRCPLPSMTTVFSKVVILLKGGAGEIPKGRGGGDGGWWVGDGGELVVPVAL